MRKERPQLYKNFKPTEEQIAYFIIGNTREYIDASDKFDGKRVTRSIKSVRPVLGKNSFAIFREMKDIECKKWALKAQEKKKQREYYSRLFNSIKSSNTSDDESKIK